MQPCVIKPIDVVEGPGITITEYFGHVASKDGAASLAIAKVKHADKAGFQAPQFAEYVICNEGSIEFVYGDSTSTRIEAGEAVFLPKGFRVKWTWPTAATYTVVCLPAFSPALSGSEVDDPSCTVVNTASRQKLAELHHEVGSEHELGSTGVAAVEAELSVVKPVDVVQADAITITEYFGHVASKDGTASLAMATVREASEEAFQAPQFDEYVICTEGSIDFQYGDGKHMHVKAGEGVFLPKGLRVKWIWPEATKYTVLCLPAFSPELSGRESDENATVAKDSLSMERLESLHNGAKRQKIDEPAGDDLKLSELKET